MRKYSVTEWWPYTDVTTCAPSFFLGIHTFFAVVFVPIGRPWIQIPSTEGQEWGKNPKILGKRKVITVKNNLLLWVAGEEGFWLLGLDWSLRHPKQNRTNMTAASRPYRLRSWIELPHILNTLDSGYNMKHLATYIYIFPMINGKQMTALREPERVGIPFISLSIPSLGMRQTNETMQPTWIYYSISLLSFHSIQNSIRIFQEFKKKIFLFIIRRPSF